MDLIAEYGGDDEPVPEPMQGVLLEGTDNAKATEEEAAEPLPADAAAAAAESVAQFQEMRSKMAINLAPVVKELDQSSKFIIDPKSRVVYHNPKVEELFAPTLGPTPQAGPRRAAITPGQQNTLTGFVENDTLSDEVFKQQFIQFVNKGYALDPTQNPHTGASSGYIGAFKGTDANDADAPAKKRSKKKSQSETKDPSNVDSYLGPWAQSAAEKTLSGPTEEQLKAAGQEPQAEEAQGEEAEAEEGETAAAPPTKRQRRGKDSDVSEVGGVFHGQVRVDSLGRTWIEPPAGVKKQRAEQLAKKAKAIRGDEISNDVIKMMKAGLEDEEGKVPTAKEIAQKWKPSQDVTCYVPKRVIHEWKGHEGPVWKSTLFPGTAHLMMSCSTDKTVKIWDYYNNRRALMTYYGHNAAVRDICFSADGTRFTSASFDRDVRLWDTETGACLGTFTNGSIPNCVRMHPSNSNEFICGTSNKRILQWDARTKEIAQEYDRHLGAVNSLTFIDEARRFVSTSDDKTILVWEWGIAVDIKRVADPSMNSMPAVGSHPNNKWLLMQSLDNQILVYSSKDKFRLNNRKVFKGHTNAGFAIQPNMSPDGRYVISGDHEGRLWIWDWKTTQRLAVKPGHSKVLMYSEWHPYDSSRVITCSWDGSIKLWD